MIDPEKLLEVGEELNRAREAHLKWKHCVDRLKRGEKTTLAEAYLTAPGSTAREKEALSLTSEIYRNYLSEWDKAQKETIKAQVKFENLETQFEALQSYLAYLRDTTKRLG